MTQLKEYLVRSCNRTTLEDVLATNDEYEIDRMWMTHNWGQETEASFTLVLKHKDYAETHTEILLRRLCEAVEALSANSVNNRLI